ncbi:MAG: hypothetical protein ABSG83_13850 [Roseiarcus sp.]|jgi:hypothetical protein
MKCAAQPRVDLSVGTAGRTLASATRNRFATSLIVAIALWATAARNGASEAAADEIAEPHKSIVLLTADDPIAPSPETRAGVLVAEILPSPAAGLERASGL